MSSPILIKVQDLVLKGELEDNAAGKTLAENLPLQISMQRWGEELYGKPDKPLGTFGGETQEVMEKGDLAFHDDTGWFCIFWGPTPSSKGQEIRAAFPVHKVGFVTGDWEAMSKLPQEVNVLVEADSA